MTTFTIDTDITAHAAAPAAQDTLTAFASQKEFSKIAAEWPISRLVDVWNSFAGAHLRSREVASQQGSRRERS